MNNYQFLQRSANNTTMIESSKYICEKNGVNKAMKVLPEVSAADIDRCKSHVSGHIHLLRRSTPEYYQNLTDILEANDAVLMYIYNNYDIFGRYGSQKLKDELSAINLKLGATLSENNVGTNAAVMASRSPVGTWVIGEEHYADVLKKYAAYAFRINGKYERKGYIMLITYKENVSKKTERLFKFIESTECIVTAGLVAEDVIMRDTLQRNEYSKAKTSNMVIMIDNIGAITFVNDVYYDFFAEQPMNTINKLLIDLHPELSQVIDDYNKGKRIVGRPLTLIDVRFKAEQFFIDCNPIKTNGKNLGTFITIYKGKTTTATENEGNVSRYTFEDIIGVADGFKRLKSFAEQIAPTPSPVLIQGESGTGKELFANAIHCSSDRSNKPFVAVNCAAIPKDLIGSELFGYVGGSFTGANKNGAKGKFEIADGGTLFLDEIGEMPLEMQSVLLRALEANSIMRIGGSKPIPVDVRIITATNRDLQKCIAEGSFRADLYYRLNVINLHITPLRQRKEDIPVLVDAFIKNYSRKNNVEIVGISSDGMQALMEYSWPGNVRELRNTIERGLIVAANGLIERKDLGPLFDSGMEEPAAAEDSISESFKNRFAQSRRETALKLLEENGGNKAKVAKQMGVSRSTLYRILGIEMK